jgi:hypothetical protein
MVLFVTLLVVSHAVFCMIARVQNKNAGRVAVKIRK